jgi:hypothetical protein
MAAHPPTATTAEGRMIVQTITYVCDNCDLRVDTGDPVARRTVHTDQIHVDDTTRGDLPIRTGIPGLPGLPGVVIPAGWQMIIKPGGGHELRCPNCVLTQPRPAGI